MEMIIGEGGVRDTASIALSTSKNRRIPNQRMSERSPQSMFAAKQLHAKGSRQLRSLRSSYNCVGMVFANRRTFVEPEQIPMILQDDEYAEVAEMHDLKPGDVVLYMDPNTEDIKHVGLVLAAEVMFGTKKIRVLSQFGRDGEYIHDLDDVPRFYGETIIKFYSESRTPI